MAPNIATDTAVEIDASPGHRKHWGPVATGGFPAHLAPGS